MDDEKKIKEMGVNIITELPIEEDHTPHDDALAEPTEEDWKNLREVADKLPTSALLIILIEFCERFTFLGLSGPFQNFIQQPPPPSYPAEVPGALGKGQQTATALTTFFNFWCYFTPFIGAIIADQYLGKYKTILIFSCVYLVGLVILVCSAIPAAIENGASFPLFIVSLLVIGTGTGGIKSNVSPLVAEQCPHNTPFIRTLPSGERVIVSPQATYQNLFNLFYWGINCGSLASVVTTVIEKNVGFWAAFLLPACVFIPGIILVIVGKNWYIQTPPRGSIFLEVGAVIRLSFKHGLEGCKPSRLQETDPEYVKNKVTWDDVFIDELRRTFRACIVFCWFPVYWLCYSQMTNNLVSLVAQTQTGSVPNDIMQNINPLTLVICIPIMDRVFYPLVRKLGFPMRPMVRITCGFIFSSLAMGYSAIIQHLIYSSPPYYDHPAGKKNDISAAIVVPSYVLIAISEIFASITGLEYAFKKAPEKMKSLVMAMFLFTNCISSLLGFALVPVAVDPKLLWMYTGISVAMFICAILFYICHGKNDATDVAEDNIVRAQSEKKLYAQNAHHDGDDQVKHDAAIVDYEANIKSTI